MKALPWILVLIFVTAGGFLFTNIKKSETELARLRAKNVELQHAAVTGVTEPEATPESLAEKEKAELIRLRNEVGVLRRDKQKLSAQVQQAQQSSERLLQTQQAQQAQQAQLQQQQGQQLAQQTEQAQAEKAKNACINNLRQLDGAKQQWALENRQSPEAVPTAQNLAPYLSKQTIPVCPSGGIYTLGNLETFPTCSIAGHALTP